LGPHAHWSEPGASGFEAEFRVRLTQRKLVIGT